MTQNNKTFDIRTIIGSTREEKLDLNGTRIFLLPLEDIENNTENPYECRDIEELADNIEDQGFITPVTVYKGEDDQTVLLSGHRRKAAAEYLTGSGRSYSFSGRDITGKIPAIFASRPKTEQREMLNIISANAQRDMTNDEKNAVILKCQTAVHTLVMQGVIKKEKGQREAALISSYTGIAEHYVKDFLASKRRAEVAGYAEEDPEPKGEEQKKEEVSEEQKMFRKHKKAAENYLKCLLQTRYQSLGAEEVNELKELWKPIKEAVEKLGW
jgi:ParB-like chromosome segregation protein Spo0J